MNIFKHIKCVDLTHTLNSQSAHWSGGCGFQHRITSDYADCTTEVKFRVQKLEMFAGIGTHMDAPAHCIPDGKTIDEISLQDLLAPCVVIDVSTKAHEKYLVTCQDIIAFEEQYGKIAKNTFVIIYAGWEKFWNQPEKFHNNLIFPSVAKETAELLLSRNIVGLGIDTLSADAPANGYPVHQLILGAGKYLVENVANANQLPPIDAHILVLPIKIQGATEAPVRMIAMISRG